MEEYKDQIYNNISKICVTCGKEFYRKKCLSDRDWSNRKFCSWGCRRYNTENIDTTKFHKRYNNIEYYTRCFNCGEVLDVHTEYEFNKRKFCSKSCSLKYKNPSNYVWDEERKLKKSIKQKKLVEEGRWINPIYCEGVIEKIKNTKRLNPIKFSEERLELSSRMAADRIVKGTNKNLGCYKYGKRGYFFSKKNNKKIFYRSQFEKRAFEMLEEDDSINWYKHEPFYLKYKLNNKTRYYIPDILAVCILDKNKLIEVKPIGMTTTEEFLAKEKSAKEYCKINNINYELWTEVVLFPNRNKY